MGPCFPSIEPSKKFTLDMSGRKGVIVHSFYRLYKEHKSTDKMSLAKYLKFTFSNFESMSLENLYSHIKDYRPDKMFDDIERYL